LISISQEAEVIKLVQKMRKAGVSCSIEFGKIGKGMEYANALKIPYVIFVGEEEVGKKKYKLKNMETGKEEFLSEKQLIKKFGK
jgi:histidyl-tRNA synthetase